MTVARWQAALAACSFATHAAAASYSIVELGTLGGNWSSGAGLNNRGEVAGSSHTSGGVIHPFVYRPQGMVDLGTPPGNFGQATAINDTGAVAGYYAHEVTGEQRLFVYRDGVVTTTDPRTLGVTSLQGQAFNSAGTLVGQAEFPGGGGAKAFALNGGTLTSLGTLGGVVSIAYGLNSAGAIVGAASTPGDAELRPAVWVDGVIKDLGSLGGRLGAAHAINESGQIVGDSRLAGNVVSHAFVYEHGVMRDLDPDPDRHSSLLSINSMGDAVGASHVYKGGRLLPLYSLLNPYTDWTITAQAINDQGLILASGCRSPTYCRAVLLTSLRAPDVPPSGQVNVIEFYHAAMDHFFITSVPAEIEALDAGHIPGWERTGEYFRAYASQVPGVFPVCRFRIPPPLGDSHFFSASSAECASTRAKFPELVYETGEAFFIGSPDAAGACPSGTTPVHRLWSRRVDSNHRYTTNPGVRDTMVKAGWLAEGDGPDTTIMCAPLA